MNQVKKIAAGATLTGALLGGGAIGAMAFAGQRSHLRGQHFLYIGHRCLAAGTR